MTIIAYREGIMACDSCWANENTIVSRMIKIIRTSVGGLIGAAGDADTRELYQLLDKVKTPRGIPLATAIRGLYVVFDAMFVLPKGKIYMVYCGHNKSTWYGGAYEIQEPFAATGSGTDLALAAMACGKSAKEACSIACRFDINCRPPVHTVRLSEDAK